MADDPDKPAEPDKPADDGNSGASGGKQGGLQDKGDKDPREKPDKGLGGERMIKELQERYDKLRDWTDAQGLTDPHDRDDSRGDKHFFDKDTPPLDLFRDSAKERTYHLRGTEYMDIAFLGMERGFHVTSDTGGKHNVGSAHGRGNAVDFRTFDKTPQEIDDFINEAKANGYRVRDERVRPPNQKEWSGPHIHVETNPGNFPLRDSGTRVRDAREFSPVRPERDTTPHFGSEDHSPTGTPPPIKLRLP